MSTSSPLNLAKKDFESSTCTKPTGRPPANWDSLPVKFTSVVCFIGPEKPQGGGGRGQLSIIFLSTGTYVYM